MGKLYLVATPIGNLEDITLRAVRVLKEVDCIFAEDTRHTSILLNHLGIKKPLVSCHEHNEQQRAAELMERLDSGENIAYVSDAGMPGISDPGERLIRACIDNAQQFEVIPGPSASLTAAVLSGLDCGKLLFLGFLPRTGKPRKELISELKAQTATAVIYENPQRVGATLSELKTALGAQRPCALCRELTKLYEETVRGTLGELAERYRETPPKGECVLVIGGAEQSGQTEVISESELMGLIEVELKAGMSAKAAAAQVSAKTGISRNAAYALALKVTGR